jgi:RNA polymerase sigma-70 factor (ECF subfamily)
MTPGTAASAFLGEEGSTGVAAGEDTLGDRVLRLAASARAAWPGIDVPTLAFCTRLGELAAHAIEAAERLHVGDLWLALAASTGDRRAHDALQAHALQRALDALRTRGAAASDCDEVAQVVRAALLVSNDGVPPRILGYAGRAPLHRWLTVVAVRTFEGMRRRAAAGESLDADDALAPALESPVDLEYGLIRAEAKHALVEALRRAAADLDREDRVLLRLHVVDRVGIDEIARLYSVHRATASRKLERARRDLGRHTRRHLATSLALPPWEVESLIRIVRSSFHSVVGTLLASTSG